MKVCDRYLLGIAQGHLLKVTLQVISIGVMKKGHRGMLRVVYYLLADNSAIRVCNLRGILGSCYYLTTVHDRCATETPDFCCEENRGHGCLAVPPSCVKSISVILVMRVTPIDWEDERNRRVNFEK